MLGWIRRLFSRTPVPTPRTHIWVQLTPIPFNVIELTETKSAGRVDLQTRVRPADELGDDRDACLAFLHQERDAFGTWCGVDADDPDTVITGCPVYPGLETGFTILYTLPRHLTNEELADKYPRLDTWLTDLHWCCPMGDQSAVYDGQPYSARARWIIPLQ